MADLLDDTFDPFVTDDDTEFDDSFVDQFSAPQQTNVPRAQEFQQDHNETPFTKGPIFSRIVEGTRDAITASRDEILDAPQKIVDPRLPLRAAGRILTPAIQEASSFLASSAIDEEKRISGISEGIGGFAKDAVEELGSFTRGLALRLGQSLESKAAAIGVLDRDFITAYNNGRREAAPGELMNVLASAQRRRRHKEGGAGSLVTGELLNTAGDIVTELAQLRVVTGVLPGQAAGGVVGRLAHAMQIAAYKGATTEGTLKERLDTAKLSFFYMATPAFSGAFKDAVAVKGVDFVLNSIVTLTEGALTKEGRERLMIDARERAKQDGDEGLTDLYFWIEVGKQIGTDAAFSLMTKTYNKGLTSERLPTQDKSKLLSGDTTAKETSLLSEATKAKDPTTEVLRGRETARIAQESKSFLDVVRETKDALPDKFASPARQARGAADGGRLPTIPKSSLFGERDYLGRQVNPDNGVREVIPEGSDTDLSPAIDTSGISELKIIDDFGIDTTLLQNSGDRYVAGTAKSVLDIPLRSGNNDQKALASFLRDNHGAKLAEIKLNYENSPDPIKDKNGRNVQWKGGYSAKDGVRINFANIRGVEDANWVALHETVHALTSDSIARGAAGTETLKALEQRVKEYAGQDSTLDPRIQYAFSSTEEFAAAVLAEPEFRDYLKTVPAEGGTVWSKVVSVIKGFLGIEEGSLSEAEKAVEALMETTRVNEKSSDQTVLSPDHRTVEQVLEQQRQQTLVEQTIDQEARFRAIAEVEIRRQSNDGLADYLKTQAFEREQRGEPERAVNYSKAANLLRKNPDSAFLMDEMELHRALGFKSDEPGKVTQSVMAEIERVRERFYIDQYNRPAIDDAHKGIPAPPVFTAQHMVGDRTAFDALQKYNDKLKAKRESMPPGRKFSVPLQSWTALYPNGFEVLGLIETSMGEPRIYESADQLVRGRQYQEKAVAALHEKMTGEGMTPNTLRDMPENQWRSAIDWMEGKDAPGLLPRWKKMAEFFLQYDKEIGKRINKVNRARRYAVENKGKFTDEQKEAMEPLRESYLSMVKGEITRDDWNTKLDNFVDSKDSDVLVRDNYFPHLKKFKGSTDYGDFMEESYVEDQAPAARQATGALQAREDRSQANETDNPLEQMYRHIRSQQSIYYLRAPVNEIWAKVVKGYFPNKEKANTRGGPLVTDLTAKAIGTWLENVIGRKERSTLGENVIRRARGNHFKSIVSSGSIISKQGFQPLLGGSNDPRYTKLSDFFSFDTAYEKQKAELIQLFGEEKGKELWKRIDAEVLLGKQMLKEFYGDDVEHEVSFKDAWRSKGNQIETATSRLGGMFWKPLSLMTDNKLLDAANKLPFVGGDMWATINRVSDGRNRIMNTMEWMRKGKDVLMDKNMDYSDARKRLATNRLFPWEEARIADLLSRGKKVDAVLEFAKDHTRIGQYVYDTKMRSLIEAYPAARILTQYATWWRGYAMRTAREWRSLTGDDWFSDNPKTQRMNAMRSLAFLATQAGVGSAIHSYMSGREPDDIEETNQFIDAIKASQSVDPFAPSGVGGLGTLATPINQLRAFIEQGDLPSQAGQQIQDYVRENWLAGKNAHEAWTLIREGKEKGDRKIVREGEKLIMQGFKDAFNRGDRYFNSYWVAYAKATKLMDIVSLGDEEVTLEGGKRNENYLLSLAEEALGKKGVLPRWWDRYEPDNQDRNFRQAAGNFFVGGNRPFVKDEDKKRKRRSKTFGD